MKLFRKKELMEWNEYQQLVTSIENLDFITATFKHSLRNLSLKETDKFGMIKERARTPNQILEGQIVPY